jgi:hypothetical protein
MGEAGDAARTIAIICKREPPAFSLRSRFRS